MLTEEQIKNFEEQLNMAQSIIKCIQATLELMKASNKLGLRPDTLKSEMAYSCGRELMGRLDNLVVMSTWVNNNEG